VKSDYSPPDQAAQGALELSASTTAAWRRKRAWIASGRDAPIQSMFAMKVPSRDSAVPAVPRGVNFREYRTRGKKPKRHKRLRGGHSINSDTPTTYQPTAE